MNDVANLLFIKYVPYIASAFYYDDWSEIYVVVRRQKALNIHIVVGNLHIA